MKIRRQLVVLVAAVLGPVALLAAVLTLEVWGVQREAYLQRYLDRVSALRLALDTEIDAAVRVLRAMSATEDAELGQRLPALAERIGRHLASNPEWAHIGLLGRDGRLLASAGTPAVALRAGAGVLADVQKSGTVVVSNAVASAGGIVTYIGVPVLRRGQVDATLYIAVDNARWLHLLQRQPVADDAALTLTDREGVIVARTLNNERWVGKRSSPAYWGRTIGRSEGSFINVGLEGQRFYGAFSRSRSAGWVLGLGVPQEHVEGALRMQTLLTALAVLAVAGLAGGVALVIGRRISGALERLAAAAKSVATTERLDDGGSLPVAEAETVRQALRDTAQRLHTREAARETALVREAHARAQAEHANAAKDEFLAMLGHELRNPLSAMKSASALLLIAQARPDVQKRAREVIERQIGHLTEIVDDLLDVSRLNSGKVVLNKRRLDVAQVAQHVLDAFRDASRCKHVTLEAQLEPVAVVADETRLEQMVSNLLDNACKYTGPGGHVRLAVRADGDEAVLTVQDSGCGIAPELLPYVFDVFAQGQRSLDRSQGGLGLGLTVVRRLVELHGGTVDVASEGTDHGSTFRLRLPLAGSTAAEAPRATPAALAPQRIVVVDDSADNRELISAQLQLRGHTTTIAVDGPSGLATILQTWPDVALVDLGLPGLDGTQIARQVRAAPGGAQVRLIALTGYGAPETREQALAAGFDRFLVKPFDIHAFEAAVVQQEPEA